MKYMHMHTSSTNVLQITLIKAHKRTFHINNLMKYTYCDFIKRYPTWAWNLIPMPPSFSCLRRASTLQCIITWHSPFGLIDVDVSSICVIGTEAVMMYAKVTKCIAKWFITIWTCVKRVPTKQILCSILSYGHMGGMRLRTNVAAESRVVTWSCGDRSVSKETYCVAYNLTGVWRIPF